MRDDTATTHTDTPSGIRIGVMSSVWQSMSNAWSFTPATDVSWSMMPHGTLVAMCSARRHTAAMVAASASIPNARAAATSSAALDDKPPPIGTVVDTVPVKPRVGMCRSCMAAATPATYRPHGGCTAAASEAGRLKRTSPARSPLRSTTSGEVVKVRVVSRSMAMGNTKPPV